MQLDQQRKNMMDLAIRTKDAGVLQAIQDNNKKLEEKFQVPDVYPVGIELDKAIAEPGSDADIVLVRATALLFHNTMVRLKSMVPLCSLTLSVMLRVRALLTISIKPVVLPAMPRRVTPISYT